MPEQTHTGPADGLPLDLAPRDGTTLRLLVDYSGEDAGGPLEDDSKAWTIGHNSFDNTGEDRWVFAGWCWTHDHYSEGSGKVIAWLPFHGTSDHLALLRHIQEWAERANPAGYGGLPRTLRLRVDQALEAEALA